MRKILFIFALLTLSATQACADQLISPNKGPYVLVFETKDKMEYFIKECAGKGNRAYEPDCFSCVKAMVDSGTRCSVIQRTFTARKIRIMGPKFIGKIGWVPMEMVQ